MRRLYAAAREPSARDRVLYESSSGAAKEDLSLLAAIAFRHAMRAARTMEEQRFSGSSRSRSEHARIIRKSAPTYRYAHVDVVGRLAK
jgi:hypothetical protein